MNRSIGAPIGRQAARMSTVRSRMREEAQRAQTKSTSPAAIRDLGVTAWHHRQTWNHPRAHNSHQPVRRRERKMQRFESPFRPALPRLPSGRQPPLQRLASSNLGKRTRRTPRPSPRDGARGGHAGSVTQKLLRHVDSQDNASASDEAELPARAAYRRASSTIIFRGTGAAVPVGIS